MYGTTVKSKIYEYVVSLLYRKLQACETSQNKSIYMQKRTKGHVLFWQVLYSPVFKLHHTPGFIHLLLLITWNEIAVLDSVILRRSYSDIKRH